MYVMMSLIMTVVEH